jgi:hypothetical protein
LTSVDRQNKESAMPNVRMSFGCGLYDRVTALATGEVKPEGIDLDYVAMHDPRALFDRVAAGDGFDAGWQRPIRQQSLDPPGGEGIAQDEFGQNAETGPGSQRRQHRVTVIDAQRTRRPHCRGSAIFGEAPNLGRRCVAVPDAAMLGEVKWMLRPAVLFQVCGRADQIGHHLAKPARNERGVGQDGDADRRVEALADKVDHRIAQVEIDRHLRIGGKEFRQRWRDVQQPERHRCSEPHQSTRRRCLRQGSVLGGFALCEDVGSAASELPSGVGEREPT